MSNMRDPKYDDQIGDWEMQSIVVFDTDCINVLEEKTVNFSERDKDEEERDDRDWR